MNLTRKTQNKSRALTNYIFHIISLVCDRIIGLLFNDIFIEHNMFVYSAKKKSEKEMSLENVTLKPNIIKLRVFVYDIIRNDVNRREKRCLFTEL